MDYDVRERGKPTHEPLFLLKQCISEFENCDTYKKQPEYKTIIYKNSILR